MNPHIRTIEIEGHKFEIDTRKAKKEFFLRAYGTAMAAIVEEEVAHG